MTREDGLKMHRLLWHTIAEMLRNGEIVLPTSALYCKEMAFKKIGETREIEMYCYCCEVSDCCKECLVVWSELKCGISEYGKFAYSVSRNNVDDAVEYAEKIANLPARKIPE